jgi:hypothetical protein
LTAGESVRDLRGPVDRLALEQSGDRVAVKGGAETLCGQAPNPDPKIHLISQLRDNDKRNTHNIRLVTTL